MKDVAAIREMGYRRCHLRRGGLKIHIGDKAVLSLDRDRHDRQIDLMVHLAP